MFEHRLRILDVGEGSFLGIVEGFPEVLGTCDLPRTGEADLTRALIDQLERLKDSEATQIDMGDFPTVRTLCLYLSPRAS